MNDKLKLKMRALAVEAYLALALGAILPFAARLEGKRSETWFFAFLFIGMVGITAYEVVRILLKRIHALESKLNLCTANDSDINEAKPQADGNE